MPSDEPEVLVPWLPTPFWCTFSLRSYATDAASSNVRPAPTSQRRHLRSALTHDCRFDKVFLEYIWNHLLIRHDPVRRGPA